MQFILFHAKEISLLKLKIRFSTLSTLVFLKNLNDSN